MGDEKHGLLREGGKEAAVELTLGRFVERRGYLVEQKNTTRAQPTASNGNALGLAFAKSAATFTQFGVETIGQPSRS